MSSCSVCGSSLTRHFECDGSGDGVWGRGTCGTCYGTGVVCSRNKDHNWKSGRRERDDDDASSGGDCFVATAACGSRDDAAVIELRRFRDEQLSRTTAGRRFIAWYYRRGPALAAVIRGHDVRRAVVRVLLVHPAAWMAAGGRHPVG